MILSVKQFISSLFFHFFLNVVSSHTLPASRVASFVASFFHHFSNVLLQLILYFFNITLFHDIPSPFSTVTPVNTFTRGSCKVQQQTYMLGNSIRAIWGRVLLVCQAGRIISYYSILGAFRFGYIMLH